MQIKLHRIFARIRALCGEIDRIALVAKLACVKRAVVHKKRRPLLFHALGHDKRRVRRRFVVRKNENGIGDAQCFVARNTYNADTTCTYR